MFNFVRQAWIAVVITLLVIIDAIVIATILSTAIIDSSISPSGEAVVDCIEHLEHRISATEAALDRLQRVTLTEFRSQGALWVDRLFPQFEEVE